MARMPEFAPLVFLIFLGSCALLGLAGLAVLYGLARRKRAIAGWSAAAFGMIVAGYLVVLLLASLTSHEQTLSPGGLKYFCEVDCHLAYSVAGASAANTLDPETHLTQAKGRFVLVRLKIWFDADSISSHRGNGPLAPGPRRALLVDDQGRAFAPSAGGQAALAALGEPGPVLSPSLHPGESSLATLVYDLPADARNPRLLITDEDDPIACLIIGHENSPFHRKIYLSLGQPDSSVARGVSD
jgi:hypothetical protein